MEILLSLKINFKTNFHIAFDCSIYNSSVYHSFITHSLYSLVCETGDNAIQSKADCAKLSAFYTSLYQANRAEKGDHILKLILLFFHSVSKSHFVFAKEFSSSKEVAQRFHKCFHSYIITRQSCFDER